MLTYRAPPVASAACRSKDCAYHGALVGRYPRLYRRQARTPAGTPRYECKGCGQRISNRLTTRPQRRANTLARDLDVFRSVINKLPIRRIGRRDQVNAATCSPSEIDVRQCGSAAAEVGLLANER